MVEFTAKSWLKNILLADYSIFFATKRAVTVNAKICVFYRIAIVVWKNVINFADVKLVFWRMSTQDIKTIIAEYFKTQPVLKAWLFGSFARGEETPDSDVDLLIVLDNSKPVGLKFFGMYEDLKELLGRDVDLVTERSLAPFARQSVERDRQLIYERAN